VRSLEYQCGAIRASVFPRDSIQSKVSPLLPLRHFRARRAGKERFTSLTLFYAKAFSAFDSLILVCSSSVRVREHAKGAVSVCVRVRG